MNCSGGVAASGTWSLAGDVLKIDGTPGPITWFSNDEWYLAAFDQSLYRKGTEPGGYVFDHPETELSLGVWGDGNLPHYELKLYSFTASSAWDHDVYWEDGGNGGGLLAAKRRGKLRRWNLPLEGGVAHGWPAESTVGGSTSAWQRSGYSVPGDTRWRKAPYRLAEALARNVGRKRERHGKT
jgi:hypothetical protein